VIRNKKKFYQQAMVEVKMLKFIKDHDPNDTSNMVHMLDFFVFRKHVCISCEVLGMNLYDAIKKNNFRGLPLNLIRKYAYQILQSLAILKKHSIIHCDLKPENILLKLKNKAEVKLIDFGSSCFSHERVYTYIQSRFYRAPEVMLALPYTTAIDIWSLGCILAELYTASPIFPGESESEQMALIMEVNGLPPRGLLARATRKEVFFDENGFPLSSTRLKERGRTPGTRTLGSSLNCDDQDFVDFITKCLEWDPEKRITPEDALKHPWILKERSSVVESKKGRIKLKTEVKNPLLNKSLVNTVTTIQSIANITMGSTITPKARNIGLTDTKKHKHIKDKLFQFYNKLKMNNNKKK
jgi:dual specificity tyrosine-phosphorylation-regulated kinase 2/3/4